MFRVRPPLYAPIEVMPPPPVSFDSDTQLHPTRGYLWQLIPPARTRHFAPHGRRAGPWPDRCVATKDHVTNGTCCPVDRWVERETWTRQRDQSAPGVDSPPTAGLTVGEEEFIKPNPFPAVAHRNKEKLNVNRVGPLRRARFM